MLLAMILMVAAPDHWNLQAGWLHLETHHHDAVAADDGHHAGSEEAHGRHCHGDLANCSDVPLTAVGGLALLAGWLHAGFVATSWITRLAGAHRLAGVTPAVVVPPPRLFAANPA